MMFSPTVQQQSERHMQIQRSALAETVAELIAMKDRLSLLYI